MVEGDLDSNDARIQAMSTDKDSTSDEAPTESMNAVSPDQPDELQYNGGGPSDASSSSTETGDAANQMTAAESAAAVANSVEEDEDESADSEEGGKKQFGSRSAKHPSPVQPQQPPPRVIQSPALPPQPIVPQPIVPQPKALVRSRTSKRRSRTNRRQI
ncbi:uncharacterized protein DDB_G0284459 isoform X2 [Toxotes jaculatrix]|nr:uncharacterized protein DDB_G0284459 isoform X2 [Toxotes jaculatrix]XP_040908908.1 uncharacterized protein DDB_G0284459 isoform X2 [Toxotes jaculatrix]